MKRVVINKTLTGAKIKDALKNKGISVKELAVIMDISPQNIYRTFEGAYMPSLKNMVRYSHALDVTLDELVVTELVEEDD